MTQALPSQATLNLQKNNDPLKSETLWFNKDLDSIPLGKTDVALKELQTALQSVEQITATQSKALQMVATAANENVASQTQPAFMTTFGNETAMDWVDLSGQEWTFIPALPSALNGTSLTSIVTQAPHAYSAHPATHTLALSIQKNGSNSDSRNWTLQLDPPDLGKVEVELNFSKDKLVKAVMVIEKPETWMMLQRDAQILERALQEAGLDVSSDNLEFELASQDHDFDGNGSGDGHGNGGGNSDTDNIEIIETTMTWYTDADSGLQRYDLVV